MVLGQNEYKNPFEGVLRTKITFVTHSSPSCYFTLRIRLSPQKTYLGDFIIVFILILTVVHVYMLGFQDSMHSGIPAHTCSVKQWRGTMAAIFATARQLSKAFSTICT